MRSVAGSGWAGFFLLLALHGCTDGFLTGTVLPADRDVPTDGSVQLISIMIDAEQEDTAGLLRLTDAMQRRGLPATVYVSAEYANRHATLIQDLYTRGFEIALHGYSTGEQLATMTYDEQRDLLRRALAAVEGCRLCGLNKPVTGFRPQYFSQNEDTYRVLDELGLAYDSGFRAGQLPLAGHESAWAPFRLEGHNFVVLPVTTVEFNGTELYLCDISCAQKLTGEQFKQALTKARQECRQQNVPLVANFHGWYTGDNDRYDYWQPFIEFVDDAVADHAVFVRSRHLAQLFAG